MSDRQILRAMLKRARIKFESKPINADEHAFILDTHPEHPVECVFNKDGSLKDVGIQP